jgi:translin
MRSELEALVARVDASLSRANDAREVALPSCRRVIRLAGTAIKCVHRLDLDAARAGCDEAEGVLRGAQAALAPFPAVEHAGFLHDAEKEYVEARSVVAMVAGEPLPSASDLTVGETAWLRGLAEAASELRRHLLDRLRHGELARAEELFGMMEDTYDSLMVVDYPDALTNGLRRTLDALRAVIERSRSDLTTTVLSSRLQAAIESTGRDLG